MASESYWKQVLLSLEQMTDEEFVEFVNENGGFEDEKDQFDCFSIPIRGNGMKTTKNVFFPVEDMIDSHFELPIIDSNLREIVLKYSDSCSDIFSDDDDLEAA